MRYGNIFIWNIIGWRASDGLWLDQSDWHSGGYSGLRRHSAVLKVPNTSGSVTDVVLGYDTAAETFWAIRGS